MRACGSCGKTVLWFFQRPCGSVLCFHRSGSFHRPGRVRDGPRARRPHRARGARPLVGQPVHALEVPLHPRGQGKRIQMATLSEQGADLVRVTLLALHQAIERGLRRIIRPPHAGANARFRDELHGRQEKIGSSAESMGNFGLR